LALEPGRQVRVHHTDLEADFSLRVVFEGRLSRDNLATSVVSRRELELSFVFFGLELVLDSRLLDSGPT